MATKKKKLINKLVLKQKLFEICEQQGGAKVRKKLKYWKKYFSLN